MSYDVYFLRRTSGQSWDDALEALEADAAAEDTGERPLTPEQQAEWERVAARVREVAPGLEEFGSDAVRELTHEPTGLQLSLYGDELSLSVPYWHEGESARDVVDLLRRVATEVEAATGRTAYDPQVDAPFLEGGPEQAAAVLDDVAGRLPALAATHEPGEPAARRPLWRRLLGR